MNRSTYIGARPAIAGTMVASAVKRGKAPAAMTVLLYSWLPPE